MQPTRRSALTLVELLVVIVLITILTAATLPMLAPAVESRRMREAARGVSVFFATARSRAIQFGRPVGVEVRRVDYTGVGGTADNGVALTLFEVEVPTAYSGDDLTTGARVTFGSAPNGFGVATATVNISGGFRLGLVAVGDRIQFCNQGPIYRITILSPLTIQTDPGTFALPYPVGVETPPATITTGSPPAAVAVPAMPFQIFRQPRRTSSEPYQLPDGVAIDMGASGIGPGGQFATGGLTVISHNTVPNGQDEVTSGTFTNDAAPVVVMFAPGGAVTTCYGSSGPFLPAGDFFFLIGKRSQTPAELAGKPRQTVGEFWVYQKPLNWQDPNCFWITVRRQSGQVTTTAVAPAGSGTYIAPAGDPSTTPITFSEWSTPGMKTAAYLSELNAQIVQSRYFAREAYGEKGQ